jgi:hypothetical protein
VSEGDCGVKQRGAFCAVEHKDVGETAHESGGCFDIAASLQLGVPRSGNANCFCELLLRYRPTHAAGMSHNAAERHHVRVEPPPMLAENSTQRFRLSLVNLDGATIRFAHQ